MGKCKKRTLHKTNYSCTLTRNDALNNILNLMDKNKTNEINEAMDLISLFGISAEELSEAGVPYENLKALGSLVC